MEVRCWKTLTVLEACKMLEVRKILFVTKKKAMPSIAKDHKEWGYLFDIDIINHESVHKVTWKYDIVIIDESHCLWAFPKPSLRVKTLRKMFHDKPIIFLSGTPSPESYSQLYHQFYISDYSPWKNYKNFYKWAADYVKIKLIRTSYGFSNDYSNANYSKIQQDLSSLMLTFTQLQAWFTTEVKEEILHVPMKEWTLNLIKKLKKDKVIVNKEWNRTILSDTKVKEMQKVHQLCSGTIKTEEWEHVVLDNTKAEFIKNYFEGKKIAIYYKFVSERIMLEQTFWTRFTDDIERFRNDSDSVLCLQIVSGREGINLSVADHLVFINIDFSATSYWQARDRLTTMDRLSNKIYWVFSEWGIEDDVYATVQKKKNFTSNIYKLC